MMMVNKLRVTTVGRKVAVHFKSQMYVARAKCDPIRLQFAGFSG